MTDKPPFAFNSACSTTSQMVRGFVPDAKAQGLSDMLREAGLRPTQQRLSLAKLLFLSGNRHVCAEALHDEAIRARLPVSLATVYNTLHQFRQSGLLREVAVDGTRTYFDTNLTDHHHFYIETEDKVMDIPGENIVLHNMPEPPEGMEIARVDVVIRLKRKKNLRPDGLRR